MSIASIFKTAVAYVELAVNSTAPEPAESVWPSQPLLNSDFREDMFFPDGPWDPGYLNYFGYRSLNADFMLDSLPGCGLPNHLGGSS